MGLMISILKKFSIIENNIYMYIVGASTDAKIKDNISFPYFYVYTIAYFILFWLGNSEILKKLADKWSTDKIDKSDDKPIYLLSWVDRYGNEKRYPERNTRIIRQ